MNVSELIEKLKTLPGNLPVIIPNECGWANELKAASEEWFTPHDEISGDFFFDYGRPGSGSIKGISLK